MFIIINSSTFNKPIIDHDLPQHLILPQCRLLPHTISITLFAYVFSVMSRRHWPTAYLGIYTLISQVMSPKLAPFTFRENKNYVPRHPISLIHLIIFGFNPFILPSDYTWSHLPSDHTWSLHHPSYRFGLQLLYSQRYVRSYQFSVQGARYPIFYTIPSHNSGKLIIFSPFLIFTTIISS
jgi:hypothetical protein